MTAFDQVMALELPTRRLGLDDAKVLERRIRGEAPESILEVCQDSNQITLILAAILKDQGKGTVTTFQSAASAGGSDFNRLARQLDLQDNISALPAGRSYTWAMQRLLANEKPPVFDVCVLNGNKTWDSVGFSTLLAHMLLRRGGLLVMTDISWRMASSPYFRDRPHLTEKYDTDELETAPVQRVMDLLLPQLGYQTVDSPETRSIRLARKN